MSQISGVFGGVATNYVSNMAYLPHGAPNYYKYGNNIWPTFLYNSRLQPDAFYGLLNNSNQQFLYYFWHYWGGANNNGNLLQVDELAGNAAAWASLTRFNQSFTYDNLNRLSTASDTGGWSRSFGYDAFGNSWVIAPTGIGYGVSTPAWNVYNGSNNQIPTSPYDAAGNMLALPPSYVFTYDAENRQISETNNGTPNATYAYDGEGRRVSKTVTGSGTTVFVYDASEEMAAEYSSDAATTSPCQTCYLSYDHLGSVRMVTDQNAQVIARHDYLPFGEEIPGGWVGRSSQWGAGTDDVNQKFTGKERDSETSLDYFGARYYESALGRFMSPDWSATPQPVPYADPTNPQSLNLYNYIRNNPLSGADPDGHCGLNLACWQQFGSGFADTSYRPIVQAISHPVNTLGAIANAVMHPVDTAVAVKNAVVDTTNAALSGDPNAIGKVTGTVVSTLATAGVGKAAASLAEGAEIGEAATVVHYTSEAGTAGITESGGVLRTGTYVTLPGEIPAGASSGTVEKLLEIGPGKGSNSITFQTPNSNLAVPANGTTTSGGAVQFQLKSPVRIDLKKFKSTDGAN